MYMHVYDQMKQRRRILLICGLGRGGRLPVPMPSRVCRHSLWHLCSGNRSAICQRIRRSPHARTHFNDSVTISSVLALVRGVGRVRVICVLYARGKTSPEVVQ